ncbi:unnamed protein product [Blepharisma stoltei]|uniref:Uncharacterized protein n=1 Tax=Blepharisma stoltei TaxID=1481888 RepID=A0AAU9JPB1_9CILI|nr:unnamed protein product [Blepharisma stoltei]
MEERNYRIRDGILFRVPVESNSRISPELSKRSRPKPYRKSTEIPEDYDKESKIPIISKTKPNQRHVFTKIKEPKLSPHPPLNIENHIARKYSLTPTQEGRAKFTSLMQPRQYKEVPQKSPNNLSDLNNVAQELKQLFEGLPLFKNDQKLSKSVIQSKIPDVYRTKRKKTRRENISFDSKYLDANRASKIALYGGRSKSRTTERKDTPENAKIQPQEPPKEASNLHSLQQYFLEFHQRSKFLLSQLEQKVLGKKSVYQP